MKALHIQDLRVGYGRAADTAPAVDGVSLLLPAGHIGCLLGPSGCGKTTVLRAVAGFEPLLAGSIHLGGRALASQGLKSGPLHLPPEQRQLGLVFQEIALFPHLTAAQNVAFGLWRAPRAQQRTKAAHWLAWVGLQGLDGRYPHELSGGQQQRVALARAMAPEPALLLLDEPFSNLDTATRARLTADVRSLLKAAGQTALLVTHDEAEAQVMGDLICTMRAGRIVQQQAG